MKELSSLDLYFLVKEFQLLVNAKIDKIFQKNTLLQFQIHIPNKGKKYLKINLPSLIYLSNNKYQIDDSDKFALSLRKHITNSRIKKIEQKEFERIIQVNLETKDKLFLLYFELFKPGNIILCKPDNKILMALKYKGFGSRLIRPGIKYDYPKKEFDFINLKEADLNKLLEKSDKKSVVITLATDLGLGGFYAEYLCNIAKIDKKTQKLDDKEKKRLFNEIQKIKKTTPKGYIYKDIISPIKIYDKSEKHDSFNNLLDLFSTKEKIRQKKGTTKQEKQKKKIEQIIKTQETQIKGFETSYKENKRKAEFIYEKYTELKKIIDQVKNTLKKYSWKQVQKNKQISNINEKEKTITIEIK